MANVHMSIKDAAKLFLEIERRFVFTTPKSFLEFKDYYNKLLAEKRAFIKSKTLRLEKGIEIIELTNEQVVKIREEVKEISVMGNFFNLLFNLSSSRKGNRRDRHPDQESRS